MAKTPLNDKTIAEFAREILIQDECSISRSLAESNFAELRLFLDTLENFIESEEQRQVKALEPHATYPDFWADHYPYQWQDIIGSQLREAFVVCLMSATEFHLGILCSDAASIVSAPIDHNDLKGSTLERCKKFLTAFARFTGPSQGSWETVGDLYVLRNSIVHNAGLVDTGRNVARISAMMKRSPGISNPSAGMLKIEPEFCVYAHEAVMTFFDELHSQLTVLCKGEAKLV